METIKHHIQHDHAIEIATAHSRVAKRWNTKKWFWSDFVEKCKETKRTDETIKEYNKKSKEEQSRIKDVGGFVGGYLNGGIRKTTNVIYRSMVTLDIDHASTDFWEEFTLAYDCAALMYSTHKHTPEAPRYRLVIPLNRNVAPNEYEPICRRIAGTLGIDQFDDSTYQLARLFYWPSTSKDGEYIFELQDGKALDADEILSTYQDYKDAALWPLSSREGEAVAYEIRKAGDPTEKGGLIGAFCRAYSIEEAIEELLPNAYEKTAIEGRYTYKKGSVAAGLVCYEGKYAYSHHETDPTGRKLCNAFDLCRIHLYGIKDEGSKQTDHTKLPSYVAMQEHAAQDRRVKRVLMQERRERAKQDFSSIDDLQEIQDATEQDDELTWLEELECDKRGEIKPTAKNIMLILENDPKLKQKIWHDEFSGFDLVKGGLPWNENATLWGNRDDANLRVYLENNYNITAKDKIKDAKDAVLTKYRKHPIKDYLNSLKWDGVERLETLIIDYVGADDTPLHRAMTKKHFTAAVARVMSPGCKYDYCLILAGPEGIGKSTVFNIMGGDWFNDSLMTTEGKAAMEQLRCGWIIELAELSSIKRSDVEQVKNYISRRDDIYRAAYGSVVEKHPRQCVFCGSTNEEYFLKGDTGNRRFWVIGVDKDKSKYHTKQAEELRDQLWAEAVHYWKQGERLYLDPEHEAQAREIQKAYNDNNDDPLPDMLMEYLDTKLPPAWDTWDATRRRAYFRAPDPLDEIGTETRTKFAPIEFIAEKLGKEPTDKEYKYLVRKINKIMKDIKGWEKPTTSRHAERVYGRCKAWGRDPQEHSAPL